MKWELNEPDSPAAIALLKTWEAAQIQAIVPSWFSCEVSNVLYRYVLRGDISLADAKAAHAAILPAVFVIGDETSEAIRALEMAD